MQCSLQNVIRRMLQLQLATLELQVASDLLRDHREHRLLMLQDDHLDDAN